MWDTGLMHRFNPIAAGGAEPDFAEMIETWIAMARLDGSFGWIGIANLPSAAATAAYLPDEGFDEVFGADDARVTLGGQFFPNGTGEVVDGGIRLTGSWNFGSGTGHSRVRRRRVHADQRRRAGVGERRDPRAARRHPAPRARSRFTDGWHVQGLKGTGSYDYEVHDVFVPDHRTYELFTRRAAAG